MQFKQKYSADNWVLVITYLLKLAMVNFTV